LADARRRVNARCPACGSVEWFGQSRVIIAGGRGTPTCVEMRGVDEDEWLCNRCGRLEPSNTPLRALLDSVASQTGSLLAS
jgi:hypothetical protein